MRRLSPFPLLSAALLALWLVLTRTLSVSAVTLGVFLSLAFPFVLASLVEERARLRRPRAILRLAFRVLGDVIRSNLAVASLVLCSGRRTGSAGFIAIPLELSAPYGLAVLACIITATPGTLWVGFDPRRRVLVIHVLDLTEEAAWVAAIKRRYESALLEIFE